MSVQFGGQSVGQHGANIFYKEFTVFSDTNCKTYRLGSFYFVQKESNPVTIAEFQLIWRNTYNGKNYASVKLYFNPEDAEDDCDDESDDDEFGKDEVIEADRQVVIECVLFPFWECKPKLWCSNIGKIAFADVPQQYVKNYIEKGCLPSKFDENVDIKIISYPQYCRFQTCKKMISMGVPMTLKLFSARGGLLLKNLNTLILFSRWKFAKRRVEELSLTRNITVPVFKGRPPKKKHRREMELLKKKRQKKLMKEMKKWNLSGGEKRKYTKRTNKENAMQDGGHSSATSAASRILKKYRKNNEKVETSMKDNLNNQTQSIVKLENGDSPNQSTKVVFDDIPPREVFTKELYKFMEKQKKPILKVPSVGRAPVDFHDLLTLVVKYNGYAEVTTKRQWREIYDGLGRHSNDITNQATSIRKIYENNLLLYENELRMDAPPSGLTEEEKDITEHEMPSSQYVPARLNGVVVKTEPVSPTSDSTDTSRDRYKIEKGHFNAPRYALDTSRPLNSLDTSRLKQNATKKKSYSVGSASKPCEYKRIQNKPISTISHAKNTEPYITNCTTKNGISHNVADLGTGGNTAVTVQAGGAFKLMIQKRRGRPSNDFRRQLEELKAKNQKIEVEVFPVAGKRTRLPKWLNELDVSIINRKRRKRKNGEKCSNFKSTKKYGNSNIEIAPMPKEEIPRITTITTSSIKNNVMRASSSYKLDSPSINNLTINPEDELSIHLIPHDDVDEGKNDVRYSSGISVTCQSSTSQPIHSNNELESKCSSSYRSTRLRELRDLTTSIVIPRFPSSLPTNGMTTNSIHTNGGHTRPSTQSLGIKDVRLKNTSPNINKKSIVSNLQNLYIPNTQKPIHVGRPPHSNNFNFNGSSDKVSGYRKNGTNESKDETNMDIPIGLTLIPAPSLPFKVSSNNLTLNSYAPSYNCISPTSTVSKYIMGGTKFTANTKTPFENNSGPSLEPNPPKVYILPS